MTYDFLKPSDINLKKVLSELGMKLPLNRTKPPLILSFGGYIGNGEEVNKIAKNNLTTKLLHSFLPCWPEAEIDFLEPKPKPFSPRVQFM